MAQPEVWTIADNNLYIEMSHDGWLDRYELLRNRVSSSEEEVQFSIKDTKLLRQGKHITWEAPLEIEINLDEPCSERTIESIPQLPTELQHEIQHRLALAESEAKISNFVLQTDLPLATDSVTENQIQPKSKKGLFKKVGTARAKVKDESLANKTEAIDIPKAEFITEIPELTATNIPVPAILTSTEDKPELPADQTLQSDSLPVLPEPGPSDQQPEHPPQFPALFHQPSTEPSAHPPHTTQPSQHPKPFSSPYPLLSLLHSHRSCILGPTTLSPLLTSAAPATLLPWSRPVLSAAHAHAADDGAEPFWSLCPLARAADGGGCAGDCEGEAGGDGVVGRRGRGDDGQDAGSGDLAEPSGEAVLFGMLLGGGEVSRLGGTWRVGKPARGRREVARMTPADVLLALMATNYKESLEGVDLKSLGQVVSQDYAKVNHLVKKPGLGERVFQVVQARMPSKNLSEPSAKVELWMSELMATIWILEICPQIFAEESTLLERLINLLTELWKTEPEDVALALNETQKKYLRFLILVQLSLMIGPHATQLPPDCPDYSKYLWFTYRMYLIEELLPTEKLDVLGPHLKQLNILRVTLGEDPNKITHLLLARFSSLIEKYAQARNPNQKPKEIGHMPSMPTEAPKKEEKTGMFGFVKKIWGN